MTDRPPVTIEAGPLTFVVEHRRLVQDGVESGGPTIRVLGADDHHEYLRFDMFDVGAHYHLLADVDEERLAGVVEQVEHHARAG